MNAGAETWVRGPLGGRVSGPRRGTVLKYGGSLLVRPAWPAELRTLVAHLASPVTVVVGGGPVVDGLRTLDAAVPQPDELAHRLAIDALGLTARIVAAALGAPLSPLPNPAGTAVLEVAAWLADDDEGGRLPVGWQVTSDSIAARVAMKTDRGLLLAKSVAPPVDGADLAALAAAGWIDGHFPQAARGLATIGWATPRRPS